jgi:hypothetical protein
LDSYSMNTLLRTSDVTITFIKSLNDEEQTHEYSRFRNPRLSQV